ncbi:alkaline phosphatase family protein [Streptomyces sp. KLMMK]|uniref:alkaline phosphatase family protein n=1 Tax=Streptomyces sp. KLMMK TaxID=3109353 RepID=UPI003000EB33
MPGTEGHLSRSAQDLGIVVHDGRRNVMATGNGEVSHTVTAPSGGSTPTGGASLPFGRRWRAQITNNGSSRASVWWTVQFQGHRPILERDIDLTFLNSKLDTLFNNVLFDGEPPLTLEFVNLGPNGEEGPFFLGRETYVRLSLAPEWARVYPDLHHLKASLGGLWFTQPTKTESITVQATIHDGAPAIRLSIRFPRNRGRIDVLNVLSSLAGGLAVDIAADIVGDVLDAIGGGRPVIDIETFDLDLFLVLRPPRDHFGNIRPRFEVVARPYVWTSPDWAGTVIDAGVQLALERFLPREAAPQLAKYAENFQGWLLGDRGLEVRDSREAISLTYVGKAKTNDYTRAPVPSQPLTQGNLAKIDHIVVLMMENRSFDHMLGYLSLPVRRGGSGRHDVDGLTGSESNPKNARREMQRTFSLATPREGGTVGPRYETRGTRFMLDPGHGFKSVAFQRGDTPIPVRPLRPFPPGLSPPPLAVGHNQGFVLDFARKFGTEVPLAVQALVFGDVMGYHPASHVPIYDYLATEFAICDQWFASHPGQTWPNRFVSLTGRLATDPETGDPQIENPHLASFDPLETPTIFDHLTGAGVEWRYYEHDFAMLRTFSTYTLDSEHVLPIDDPDRGFFHAVSTGTLPPVTYIEANLTDIPPGNDDHPPADIAEGQVLVNRIYQALAASSIWSKTLFIITYDEHGGFFDHVWPKSYDETHIYDSANPTAGGFVPLAHHPDHPDLWIDHYGMRVPAFVISPWVPKSHVSHTVFDHTAILKTIMTRFLDQQPPDMGARVALSPDLGGLLTESSPRSVGVGPLSGVTLTPDRRFRQAVRGSGADDDFRTFLGGFARRVRGR